MGLINFDRISLTHIFLTLKKIEYFKEIKDDLDMNIYGAINHHFHSNNRMLL